MPLSSHIAFATRWLRAAAAIAGASFILLYVVCACIRIQYPFDLEWIEGGILESVLRVAEGRPVFARPSVEYVPFNYAPFYYYAAAPLTQLLGSGFLPLRLLSFLASLGTLGLIVLVVHRLTRDGYAAFLACALYAACYELTGAWYDLARADSLYIFLLGSAVAWMVLDRSALRAGLAMGVLLALAQLTKQSALVIVAVFTLYAFLGRRPAALVAAGTFAVLAVGSFLWMNAASDGWYAYFTFQVAGGHSIALERLQYFWMRYIGTLGVATVIGGAYLLWPTDGNAERRTDVAAFLGALAVSGWHMGLYGGGAHNSGMTGVLGIALWFGLGLHAVRRALRDAPGPIARRLELLVYAACLIQFAGLGYDPRKHVPTAADVAAGRSLVSELARQPGDVLAPYHNYLARMAGKPAHYHAMALSDVGQGGRLDLHVQVAAAVRQACETGRYSAVLLDFSRRSMLDSIPGFAPERILFTDPDVLMTRSGSRTRPEFIRLRAR